MSVRSILILSLVVVACVAVIIVSALVGAHLSRVYGPFRFRDLPQVFGPFMRSPFDRPGSHRLPAPVTAGWRGIVSATTSYAFLFLTGLLALFVFPRPLRVMRDGFGKGAGGLLQTFGAGAFGAFVLLFLTVIGVFTFSLTFALPLVLLLALLLAAWGGLIGLALALGRGLNRRAGLAQSSPILDLAFGTLVLFALTRIPIAGMVILIVLGMLALGAVIATRFGAGGAWSLAEFDPVKETQS